MDKPNWSERLEAVNTEDGRTVRVKVVKVDQDGDYHVEPVLDDMYSIFDVGGENWSGGPWRVQNIAPAKPSTPSNEELTQRMEITGDTLVMLRRVLSVALHDPEVTHEAEKLLGILPKPVDPIDPDLIEARAIVATVDPGKAGDAWDERVLAGEHDDSWDVRAALSAIKRGREIERRTLSAGGTAHE